MNIKEVENFIEMKPSLEVKLEILQRDLKTIEEIGVSAINYKLVPTKSSNISKPTEKQAIEKAGNTKQKIKRQINLIESKLDIIDKALGVLDSRERKVVTWKLIENKSYYQICADLSISEVYAKKIKRKALIKIKPVITI